MKTLTIDFDLYEEELRKARFVGYRSGFVVGKDLIIRLLNNVKTGAVARAVYDIITSELNDETEDYDFALKCAKIIDPSFNIGDL